MSSFRHAAWRARDVESRVEIASGADGCGAINEIRKRHVSTLPEAF